MHAPAALCSSTMGQRDEPSGSPEANDARDARWVEAIATGDRRALGDLYDAHAGLLMSVALQLLPNRAEAEDLLHDVFLEVWRQAHTYDPERASVRRWLLVRLRSRVLDRLKSHAWSRRRPLEQDDRRADGDLAAAFDAGRVSALIEALSEEQRAVVVASYFEGQSSSEIATSLGIPLGTVKSRMAAAMQKLRDLLEGT